MPLVNMKPLLRAARADGYAVAAFNIIDYTNAWACVAAAEEMKAPLILQVSVKTIKLFGHAPIAGWVRGLAERASVPVAFHLDHCKDLEVIRGCIANGWTSVMFDGSCYPFEENLAKTKEAYELAEGAGVGLEAEIGAIGGVEDDIVVAEGDAHLADVDECIRFAEEMPELAVFAPAIGTAHGVYKGEPEIAYERMAAISEGTGLPLALHGGTGLSDEAFAKSIARGSAKINISTRMKHEYIDAFVEYVNAKPDEYEPIKVVAEQFERQKVVARGIVETFGSSGRTGQHAEAHA